MRNGAHIRPIVILAIIFSAAVGVVFVALQLQTPTRVTQAQPTSAPTRVTQAPPSSAPTRGPQAPPSAELIESVQFALPIYSISGRVTDDEGAPLAGAIVSLASIDESRTGCQDTYCNTHIGEFPVDADGRFELHGLTKSVRYLLMAHHEHCSPVPDDDNRVIAFAGDTDLHLTLRIGGVLQGRVIDPRGNPVTHASVTLNCADGAERLAVLRIIGSKSISTGSDGVFSFTGTPAGVWELECHSDSFASPAPYVIELTDKETRSDIELRMLKAPQGTLSGLVRDHHGNPIADVHIRFDIVEDQIEDSLANERPKGACYRCKSQPDGTFTVKGVFEGVFKIRAWADGYALKISDDEALRVHSGMQIDLEMIRFGVVRGRVVDGIAQPVHQFQVHSLIDPKRIETVHWRGQEAPPPQGTEDGRFELRFSATPTDVIGVRVEPGAGFVPAERRFKMNDPLVDIDVGEIVVVKGLRLSGRVVNASRQPVENADLYLRPTRRPQDGAPDDAAVRVSESTKSDLLGHFHFEGFPAGEFTLSAEHNEYLSAEVSCLLAGEDTSIEIFLDSGRSLSGKVIGFDGRPLAGANVQVRPNHSITDAEGHYEIRGLEAGELHADLSVRAGSRNMYWGGTLPRSGSGNIVHDFDLSKGWCRVHGIVLDLVSGRQSRETHELQLYWPSPRDSRVVSNCTLGEDGTFDFLPVLPGNYMIAIGDLYTQEVIVPDSADYELRIELATSRISGVISRRDGKPFEYANLTLNAMTDGRLSDIRNLEVDDRGRFQGANIEPGSYVVESSISGYGYKNFTVEIAPGQDLRDLSIVISGGGEIHLRVVDGEGQPVPDACIDYLNTEVEWNYGKGAPLKLAPSEWELGGLPPGRYTIVAGTPELGAARLEGVEVAEGGHAAATIILPGTGARVLARVTCAGEPCGAVYMQLLTADGKPIDAPCGAMRYTNPDGTTLFDRLPPGTYTLRIESSTVASDYIDHPVTITANEGIVEVLFAQ